MNKIFFKKNIKSLEIICPEKSLISKIELSLDLLKQVDKKEYKNLFKRLNVILITNRHGYTNEFFMPEKIWFANKSMIKKNDTKWLASLILHEAFHATQFKNGKYIAPLTALEKPALITQEKFLKKVEDPHASADIKTVKREKYWQLMGQDKNSYTYFRNLLNLFKKGKIKFKRL